ncbi:MAG: translation initiation factor IF-2 N-terminal domain-containing protein, partial [Planctomycetaceae bacterium]|nr:translation initiation factor IF-2 N-terminal domain-containing protein [Planctomycetaceae bacterium]
MVDAIDLTPPREISDAVRIYTLAKELKLDSKVLVDLLAQAGITVKGSALASLTEDELAVFRAFMAKGGGAAKPAAPAGPKINTGPAPLSGPLRREDSLPPVGKLGGKPPPLAPKAPPVLKTPKQAPPPVEPTPEPEPEPEVVVEEPMVAEPVAAQSPPAARPVKTSTNDAGQPVPVRPTITPRPPMSKPTPRKNPAEKAAPRSPTIRVAP